MTSRQRFVTAPEFPTIAESGVPDFDATSWYGIFVPGRTPSSIIEKMHAGLVTILGEPSIKARFEPLGVAIASSLPAELAVCARADTELWGSIIKAANIKGDVAER